MLFLNSVVDGQVMADRKIDHDSIAFGRFATASCPWGQSGRHCSMGRTNLSSASVHSRFLSFIGA